MPSAELLDAHHRFRAELAEAEILFPTPTDGLYGRSAIFEQVASLLREEIGREAQELYGRDIPRYTFAPVYSLDAYEKTDYIASFPNLAGAIFSFDGGDREHRALLADRSCGLPWDGHLSASGTMLVPAACHPSYGQYAGRTVPDEGVVYRLESWCFRNEPAVDPMRMQAFRMLEFVTIGSPEAAQAHRDRWVSAAEAVLTRLGLSVESEAANDPFFGRAGRMLAVNQRNEDLKTEIVNHIYGDLDDGTAIASGNYHLDHFGAPYGISTSDGQVAHSACFGFGIDRTTLALLRTHGLDISTWPSELRAKLESAAG